MAGEGRGPAGARATHRAGAGPRLPQDDALDLPLQRLRGGPLRADGLHPGGRLPRDGPARRPLGGHPDHGEAALAASPTPSCGAVAAGRTTSPTTITPGGPRLAARAAMSRSVPVTTRWSGVAPRWMTA